MTLASLARSEVSAHGCREVLLYAAGSGYERGAAINIGMQLGRSTVRHQDVTVAALRSLIRAERRVTFLLVLDAPSAAGFQQLVRLPNVRLVATPAGGRSFTYLPEAIVGGTLQANDRNPAKLLALTYRLVAGLDQVIDDPCEVSQAAALQHAGKPGFAYLLARALARGGTADWVTRAGVGAAPTVRTTGFSAAAPICLPADAVTASNDAYTAHNDATFGVPGARGLLVNDSDTEHRAITLDQLDGNGGPLPLLGTSAKGAAVVVHADGGFSYDARGVAAIQALPRGQTTSDTFSYRITDGLGATDSATVTMTALGTRNHSPVTQGDTATISSTVQLHGANVLTNDSDPDGDTLAVTQLNGSSSLTGPSGDGAAVTIDPHGSFTYDPTGSTTLKALPDGVHVTDSFTYTVDDGHGGTSSATVSIHRDRRERSAGRRERRERANAGRDDGGGYAAGQSVDALCQRHRSGHGRHPHAQLGRHDEREGRRGHGQQRREVVVRPVEFVLTLRALSRGTSTTDTFTYSIKDSGGAISNTATVTVGVTGTNDPPVANADSVSSTSTTPVSNGPSLFRNDTDPNSGDTLSLNAAETTSADGATVAVNSDGTWSYDPTTSATLQALTHRSTATDTFTYSVKDNHGAVSNTATVSVTVTGDHPPVADPDSYTTSAGGTLNGSSVLTNDTDVDGDTLTAILVSGPSNASAFTLNSDVTLATRRRQDSPGLTPLPIRRMTARRTRTPSP